VAARTRRSMPALAGKPLRTRDTDAIETPARRATVTTVGRRAAFLAAFLRVNVFTARRNATPARGGRQRVCEGVSEAAGLARQVYSHGATETGWQGGPHGRHGDVH